MAPRALDVQPPQAEMQIHDDTATEVASPEQPSSPCLPAELRVYAQGTGEQLLCMVLDPDATVALVKHEVQASTGWPGATQLLTLSGVPLTDGQVLRDCLKTSASTLTARCADESWVSELEELGQNTGQEASRAEVRREALEKAIAVLLQETQVAQQRLALKVAEMNERFKKAANMVLSSSSTLEAAAIELNHNRDVLFEAVPRSSKASRHAAEELMRCRSNLLSSTQFNGEVLEKSRLLLGPVHRELQFQLIEIRGRLQKVMELMTRQSELLHLQRLRGWLSGRKVQLDLQRLKAVLGRLNVHESIVEQTSAELLTNRKSYRQSVASNLASIKTANEYLQQDEAIVVNWALNHVSKMRMVDRDFILKAVRANGEALEAAPEELRRDREVVLCAVESSKGWALQFAAEELKRDREVVLTSLRRNALSLEFAAPELRSDRQVVLAAVQVQGEALEFASPDLKQDAELVSTAIRSSCGWALQFASEELRASPQLVTAAVSANGLVLEYASSTLRGCKQILLAAVASNPSSLQFASAKLQEDREVVLAAIAKDGCALQFAAAVLKADREIVVAAVQQAGPQVLLLADVSLVGDISILQDAQMCRRRAVDLAATAQPDQRSAEISWSDSAFVQAEKTHL